MSKTNQKIVNDCIQETQEEISNNRHYYLEKKVNHTNISLISLFQNIIQDMALRKINLSIFTDNFICDLNEKDPLDEKLDDKENENQTYTGIKHLMKKKKNKKYNKHITFTFSYYFSFFSLNV